MNQPKQNASPSEADRVIARYGVRPSNLARETLRAALELERETFRTLTRKREPVQRRENDRGRER